MPKNSVVSLAGTHALGDLSGCPGQKRKREEEVSDTTKRIKVEFECGIQYQNIHRSAKKYQENLWNEEHDQPVYMTLNSKFDKYIRTHYPSVATFPKSNPVGDLDNPIESLLDQDSWLLEGFVDDPTLLWSRITPALRMASKFLTVPQTLAAFAPLVCGQEVNYQGSETKILSYSEEKFQEDLPCMIEKVRNELSALASNLKFTFVAFGGTINGEESLHPTHAIHYAPGEEFKDDFFVLGNPGDLKVYRNSHKIFINAAYAEFFQKGYQEADDVQITRTLWNFAETLVHELAHVLYWQIRNGKLFEQRQCEIDYEEPLLFHLQEDEEPELGCSIARRLHGFSVSSIVHPTRGCDSEYSKLACKWENGEPTTLNATHLVCYVEPVWMHSYLTKAGWEKIAAIPLHRSGHTPLPNFKYFVFVDKIGARDVTKIHWQIAGPSPQTKLPKKADRPKNCKDFLQLDEEALREKFNDCVKMDWKSLEFKINSEKRKRNARKWKNILRLD